MSDIGRNLEQVHARIDAAAQRAHRCASEITLLAVSKGHPAGAIRSAHSAGQRAFGESYVQEALDKMAQLTDLDAHWHFIGPIQSNKTKDIARHFDWVHGIDRFKIAQRLNDQRPADRPPLDVCIQVDTSGETSKAGVDAAQLPELARAVAALPRLRLRGLMTIPAPSDDPQAQRQPFAQLRRHRDALTRSQGLALDTLSMGMSGDLEAAVVEGATIVRIGTAIFGPRPSR